MSRMNKAQARQAADLYEVTGGAGATTALGSDEPLDPSTAAQTEYERPQGIDPNNPTPDEEASNLDGVAGAGEVTEFEFGNEGLTPSGEAGPDFLLDAIAGTWPEIGRRESAEVIIGADNRIRINPTTAYPWRAICALRITAANGQGYIGTGWLVSPRTVLTAGHCVFMHDAGGWVRSIEVIPGCNGSLRPYRSFVGTAFRSVTGWTQSQKRENDYGCIILPQNARPGDQVGYFGLAVRDDAFLKSASLNLSGYPGDKANGTEQWYMAQRTKSVSSRVITYDIDTVGGQSGSPVWILQNGQRYGVGVHTNGAQSGNSATRINSEVYERMISWKNMGL